MTIPLQTGIAYGPVASRRLGRSLGVNILPPGRKVCSFNCAYCQYGWTPVEGRAPASRITGWPSPEDVGRAVGAVLERDPAIERVTLAGNGEPTLHPAFADVVETLREIRDACAPGALLAILSNSSRLDDPLVRRGLARLDERYMKLDAADDTTLRWMNGWRADARPIVDGLCRLEAVVLQSMFVRGDTINNTTPAAIGPWLEAIERIGPQAVHLYSLDRGPALPGLRGVGRAELEAIARQVEQVGVPARVF